MRTATILLVLVAGALLAHADPRLWGEEGLAVRHGTYLEWESSVAASGDGHSLVVWSDVRDGNREIYAQLTSPAGEPLWAAGGINVTTHPALQREPVACAVTGGWIVAWVDHRNYWQEHYGTLRMGDVYAQKLDMQGNRLWSAGGFSGIEIENQQGLDTDVSLHVTDDGSGGALILWLDQLQAGSAARHVLAQHIEADGTLDWAQPLQVTETAPNLHSHELVAVGDGSGNAIAAWSTYYSSPDSSTVHCAKITPAGTQPWGPGGILFDTATGDTSFWMRFLQPDGLGGCYVAWDAINFESFEYTRVQRLDATGQVAWDMDSLFVGFGRYLTGLTASVAGGVTDGCILLTLDWNPPGDELMRAYKLDLAGAHQWGEQGIGLNNLSGVVPRFALVSDQAGGAVLTWLSVDQTATIYAQRLDAAGQQQWDFAPALSCGSAENLGVTVGGGQNHLWATTGDGELPSFLTYQRLDLQTGATAYSDTGRTLAGGITGWCPEMSVANLGGARVAAVWGDQRYSQIVTPLYYQVLDLAGAPQFAANGTRLVPEVLPLMRPRQVSQALCDDGQGGSFCSFLDMSQETQILRLTRVNANGERVGSLEGTLVWDESHAAYYHQIVPDGGTGCYLAWTSEDRFAQRRIYLMHMGAQVEQLWATPLSILPPVAEGNYHRGLTLTSDGAVLVASTQSWSENLSVTRVMDGVIEWTQHIADANALTWRGFMCAAGDGGAFITWQAPGAWPDRPVLLQAVDAQGHLLWQDPIQVTDSAATHDLPRLFAAPDGGAYLVWMRRVGDETSDILAQRLAPDGEPLWPLGGILIASQVTNWHYEATVAGGGNLFVMWRVLVGDGQESVRGRYVGPDGAAIGDWWDDDTGGLVVDTLGYGYPGVAAVGSTHVAVIYYAWGRDPQTVGNLRVQLIELDPLYTDPDRADVLPRTFALHQNYPNPFNPATEIRFDLPHSAQVELDVFNSLGQQVARLTRSRFAAGSHTIRWNGLTDGGQAAASGVYICRMRTEGFTASRKMLLLK